MIFLVDTSAWVALSRDRTGNLVEQMKRRTEGGVIATTDNVRMEFLQGLKREKDVPSARVAFTRFLLLPVTSRTWDGAAAIYRKLLHKKVAIQSHLDFLIAQIAIENKAMVIHHDKDFETIADNIEKLKQSWVEPNEHL